MHVHAQTVVLDALGEVVIQLKRICKINHESKSVDLQKAPLIALTCMHYLVDQMVAQFSWSIN
jgi:hypothetical protein